MVDVVVVVVVVVGAGPNRSTSSGRSVAFSRLWNCCSLLPWFSVASRIRKPYSWLASYAACSCAVTFHVRQPVPDGDVANVPLLPGWLLQLTAVSLNSPVSRYARSVRPLMAPLENIRSVADCTTQPGGTVAGTPKRISVRTFWFDDFDVTLSVESTPLLLPGDDCSSQASPVALSVISVPQSGGGATTVQA